MMNRESRLRQALSSDVLDRLDVDYVLVDCPPSLGLLTLNAMVAAPEVLIPIQCEYYALEGLSQLLNNIGLVQSHLNPSLHVSTILLTMYDGRTKLADQVTARGPQPLRRPRPAHRHPPQRQGQRGAGLRPDRADLRPGLPRGDELPRRGPRVRHARRRRRTTHRVGRSEHHGGPRMTERRGGLGRGLAALIPTGPPDPADAPRALRGREPRGRRRHRAALRRAGPSPSGTASPAPTARRRTGRRRRSVAGAVYREVRVDGIRANPRQPRTVFDEEALAELEHSVREFGLLQPIVVRELDEPSRRGRRRRHPRARHGRAPLARRPAGGPRRTSRPSSGAPPTTTSSATRSSRTSIASSSTRSRRPRPTSSCSPSSP